MTRKIIGRCSFAIAVTVLLLSGCGENTSSEYSGDAGLSDTAGGKSGQDTSSGSSDTAEDTTASTFSEFQVFSCVHPDDRRIIYAESRTPLGCVQISFARTEGSRTLAVEAPAGWFYATSSVDSVSCLSAVPFPEGPEASSAEGDINAEFSANDELERVNVDVELEFPATGSNPYPGRVQIEEMAVPVSSDCPTGFDG